MAERVISADDVDRFRTELDHRRQRLSTLAGEVDEGVADWHAELTGLGEQLGVAVEELRVQEEALADARAATRAAVSLIDHLFEAATQPMALTDQYGNVLRTSPVADAITGRRDGFGSRPIATWFVPEDRATVRDVLTRLKRIPSRPAELAPVTIRRSGATVIVTGTVRPAVAGAKHGSHLLWTFDVISEHPSASSALPTASADPAKRLTQAARQLARPESVDDVVREVLRLAVGYLPQARAVRVLGEGVPPFDVGVGDPVVRELTALQRTVREGPVLDAADGVSVLSSDLADDDRWPALRERLPPRVGALLAVPLDDAGAVLVAVAGSAGVFDEDDLNALASFGVHAGIAIRRARTDAELRRAIGIRQNIGEAVGILVERHRITPRQAFELLVDASQRSNRKLRDLARELVETGAEPSTMPDPRSVLPGPSEQRD
jgi:PAS domain S-box-containing protein